MEEHKGEVYERIPWEAMGEPPRDKQLWILGLAAALVAGALAYSFMSNRPVPLAAPVVEQTVATTAPPAGIDPAPPAVAAVPPAAPTAVTEADLYAAGTPSLASNAENHAAWFVREYLASDGAAAENTVLRGLLPADVPMPSGETLVFVEWVGVHTSEEIVPGRFKVGVVARYLTAVDGGEYKRMDPILVSIDIDISSAAPMVASVPTIAPFESEPSPSLGIGPVPNEIIALAREESPQVEVVGGVARGDGTWDLVVMVLMDGVSRPAAMIVTP